MRPVAAAPDPTKHFFQPIIVCLTVASVALTLFVIWISLHDLSLMRAGSEKFVGLDNYVRFLGDPRAMAALWRTVLFTTLATVIEIALGLAVVLFLDRDFAMKRLVRTLLLVPIIMTPVVVGLTWRFLFDPATGMANYLLSLAGISQVDWLGNPRIALFSVLIADIWQWTPFVILLVMAALESAPTDPLNAARVDGAREWQVTWYVLLPMLRRALAIVALIRAIDSIKAFDLFYIMTRGGPALSTETLNYYGYIVAFTNFDISYALAIAIILTVFTNVALLTMYSVLFPKGGDR
ncbi:sugar ABC transporter permease [Mesorhizobium sp. VK23B]|uniref:Sugar ABC transporter permease n=1 Tax=Mesorhizobium dulcispinae TaxID=3072316 RepID=A0ABU4X9L8_9HYPH|nr:MULTISPECIES: sugar ABC transporter permease [unclassified Mesorhizobium]MDX8465703.1 sugar ABC transporter permease [Mesorhizobium sp. VK23B]MDX8471495.1 sugar ABC transporter permease [Mesorhizobium sp. VK23A]